MPADVVVPVPDSGVPAAIGYAQQSGIPFELGIIRNHYVGRTFIEPADHIRHLGVRLKHNANRALIEGKRVILVDNSIVRGTTSMKIVEMVRSAGAARGAHAHRRAADHRPLLLRHRHARAGQAAGLALRRRRHGQVHRRRLAGLPVDRRPLPRDGPAAAATPATRPSATPASPATTRSRSTTSRASRTASSPCSGRSRPEDAHATASAATGRLGRTSSRWSPAPRAASARPRRWPLPREGAHCVLVARTVGGLEARRRQDQGDGRHGATLVPLDVTDGPGIDRLGAALYERFGRLDVLLGNAGVLGTLSPIGHIEPDDLRAGDGGQRHRQLAADPLARSAAAALRRRPRDLRHLRHRRAASCPTGAPMPRARPRSTCWSPPTPPKCAHTKVRVNLYNPGPTRTGMRAEAFPGEDPETLPPPEAHGERLIQLALPSCTMNGEWVAGEAAPGEVPLKWPKQFEDERLRWRQPPGADHDASLRAHD